MFAYLDRQISFFFLFFLISNIHYLGAGWVVIIHYRFLEVCLPETQGAVIKQHFEGGVAAVTSTLKGVWLQLRTIMNVEAAG